MKITQEADYAIRICCLLFSCNGVTDAATLAHSVAVPQRFALKILRKLSLCKIVKSYKGATGGYMLAIDPSELTIRRIIESIDGEIHISKCLSDNHCCANNPNKEVCRMHNVFCYLNQMLVERLDRLTVAEVADGTLPVACLLEKVK